MGKHYVPQEYLRGFSPSDDRRAIWMFDKVSGVWSFPAIKRVAQTKDYYSPEVESRLAAEVENPGHAALNALRQRAKLTPRGRDALANYMAVMIMRGPRKRRKGYELVPETLNATVSEVRDQLTKLRTDANSDRIRDLLSDIERVEQKYREEVPSNVKKEIESPWPSAQVLAAIREMVWRVVHMPPDRFLITTDNPAYFFEAYGLGTSLAELTFAIDPTTALLGSHQGQSGSITSLRGNAPLAKEVNRRIASGAERFVFSARPEKWIETLTMRAKPFLSRIAW